ncbi:MAG: hypothetical protein II133_00100 [Lachnospiraceae bacterium]|nr:hypothetical protein [Lachnospiraceae bacterium]
MNNLHDASGILRFGHQIESFSSEKGLDSHSPVRIFNILHQLSKQEYIGIYSLRLKLILDQISCLLGISVEDKLIALELFLLTVQLIQRLPRLTDAVIDMYELSRKFT